MISSYYPTQHVYSFLYHGQYGVDLFFVISGFIIAYVGKTRETSGVTFVKRRFQRVIPLYYIVTFAVFATTQLPGLTRGSIPSVGDLFRSLFFASWLNGPGSYPVVNVGWTLEYEMFFYAVFALSLFFSRKPWIVAAGIIVTIVLLGKGQSNFPVNAIMLEFVFGMIICAWASRSGYKYTVPLVFIIIVVILTLPAGSARDRVILYGLPSTGLVAAAVYLDMQKAYTGRLLKELGNASYSIYLVHVVTMSLACKLLARWAPHASGWLTVPLISLIGLAIGYATYRLLERPIMQLFSRLRRSGQSPVSLVRPGTTAG